MEIIKSVIGILVTVAAIIGLFVGVVFLFLIGPTIGGLLMGWAAGLFFTQTIHDTFAAFGIELYHLAIWQIGAALGFFSVFFKRRQFPTDVSKKIDELKAEIKKA